VSANFKLVVGLGNPGAEYVGTRHNVGFEVLDGVAVEMGAALKEERKWQGWVGKTLSVQAGVTLLKPNTFMNLSGRSVGALARFYRWKPEEILVIYDDVDLEVGRLRFREGGGHAGHNGVRSVIEVLGSDKFARLKLGVRGERSPRGEGLAGHVLGKFAPDEKEELENMLASAVKAVQVACSEGFSVAANRFNSSPKKAKKQSPKQVEEISEKEREC